MEVSKESNHPYQVIYNIEYRSLPQEQRRPFIEEAERIREQHKRDYPEYRYQPKRKIKSKRKEIFFLYVDVFCIG